jgi:hypothetical protein
MKTTRIDTKIIVAIIALISAVAVALISNWDKISPPAAQPVVVHTVAIDSVKPKLVAPTVVPPKQTSAPVKKNEVTIKTDNHSTVTGVTVNQHNQ